MHHQAIGLADAARLALGPATQPAPSRRYGARHAGEAAEDYRTIRKELARHSPALAEKKEIVVASKMDLTDSREHLQRFRDEIGVPVTPVSAVTGEGLEHLCEVIWQSLQ